MWGILLLFGPVDQAGETIVYSHEADGTLTMSVEVSYQGMDRSFAWILPVIAPPTEIGIASPALFDQLEAATRPIFVTEEETVGDCHATPTCVDPYTGYGGGSGGGCGASSSPGGWSGGYVDASSSATEPPIVADSGSGPGPGVTVFSSDTIGPYDTVVLGAASATEVVTWLRDHDYDIPEASTDLLEPYATAGQVFVALRLSANQPTGTLRPIRLHIPTDEACLPIRLTPIASVPRLPIRAFFLGSEPVTPQNYATAVVDLATPDYWTGRATFQTDVDAAIDDLGGQAFHVDYAGRTPAVPIALPAVADLAGETDPAALLQALRDRGYAADPLIPELLGRFMTPPADSLPASYYNCLINSDTAFCGEPIVFDPAGLVEAVQTEITLPRQADQDLVRRHGYLTRLYTSLSVAAMTLDPVFVPEPRVPDTPAVHTAVEVIECNAAIYESDAARHWEIDGATYRIRSQGPAADDSAYRRARGLVLESEAPPPTASSSSSGGCLCGVAGGSQISFGFLLGFALMLIFRRARPKR